MIRRSIYFIFFSAGLLFIFYLLQPIKNGNGFDTTIKYKLVRHWPNLPPELELGNPTGLGIDKNQHIVVLHRADRKWPMFGPMPDKPITSNTILIINKDDGKLVNSWGANHFIMPHGLEVDNEDNVWVTDVGLHQVFKFSHNGKLLMQLGIAKVPGNDPLHFNKPTDIAITKDGSFYVSDGYGNSRIIKFSAEGKYLFEWGKKGNKEGQFNIPHGIALDNNDNVYIADRQNNRIQVFDQNGRFIKQFTGKTFGAIGAVAFNKPGTKLIAADEHTFLKIRHRGSDVFIFDSTGNIQSRFGRSGFYEGPISWYHDIITDKDGNVYAGDILGNTIQKFSILTTR